MENEHLNNKAVTVPGLVCSLACYGVLCGFFGSYWLNNPDAYVDVNGVDIVYECWTSEAAGGLIQDPAIGYNTNYDISMFNVAPVNKLAGAIPDTNVTKNFTIWFEWGFIIYLVSVASVIISAIGSMASHQHT